MDQSESMEVDSTNDSSSKPEQKQAQTSKDAQSLSSEQQEKLVQSADDEANVPETDGGEDESGVPEADVQDANVMEWDEPRDNVSEVQKGTSGERQCLSTVDSSEQSEVSGSDMAVVIMEDEFPSQSEILDVEKCVSDKQSDEANDSQDQEGGRDELANPLASSSEQENPDKQESETDVLQVISVEMTSMEKSGNANPLAASSEQENPDKQESESDVLEVIRVMSSKEKSGNAGISSASKTREKHSSSERPSDKSVTFGQDERPDKVSEGLNSSEVLIGEAQVVQKKTVETDMSKMDDNEDIVELPVHKEPAMLVDLANEDELVGKNQRKKSQNQNFTNELNFVEDKAASNDGKRIKLRSLASLVDIGSGEDMPANSVVSTSHPDIPGIGEIVEHGVIIGSDEMDGLGLRISNVVGGEDCITGLTVDEDRDAFSSIQISSVTTLIDPISPEDPNQTIDDSEAPKVDEGGEEEAVETQASRTTGSTLDSGTESQISSSETVASDGITAGAIISSKEDGKRSMDNNEDPSKEARKSNEKNSHDSESTSPKIRLSSAVSEVAKDADNTDESGPPRHVYHILRSILTVKRECVICCKNVQCEFRIVKKDESGTWAFLCSALCRSQWTTSLTSNHVVEKPRLIFEKLCGMCGKDLANLARNGQFSWETREFCSKDCLTQHLNEVAGKCHMCNEKVRTTFIGKYCVRFGSDIHQFCSNTCLECYKTKIKVCCYCQKNLEKVTKVTSVSNKEYCSTKCLKRAQRRDIGQQNYGDQSPCTVCQLRNLNKYEFVSNQESYQLCSDPCLNVYKYANKVKAVPCCLCFRVMNAEDVAHYLYHGGHQLRVFCSDSCVNVFILSARKIVICEACKVKKYNFDMIHRQVDEDFRDYFYCSLNCLNSKEPSPGKKTKNGVTSTSSVKSGSVTSSSSDQPITNCNMCNAMAKAQYHMVMSDNTLRSFCRYACATKYKNTFGFQVNGIQSSNSTQTNGSVPILREKPSQKNTASQSEETENTSQIKKKTVCDSAEDVNSVTAELLRLLTPPAMVNKMTSCRPATLTKGVFCKPHPWHRQTQTESSDINCSLYTSKPPPVLPVPVPVYVPAPMMMYNMPYPVPVFIPIPLPVPIFIPTTAKTSGDIAKTMNKIQDEMPADPYEAEMLLLARASSESAEAEALAEETQENPSVASDCGSHVGIDDLKDIDVSCLDTMEEDIPRYSLKPSDDTEAVCSNPGRANNSNSEDEDEEQSHKKRKFTHGDSSPRKRLCRTGSRGSLSGSDEEREPEPTSPSFNTEPLGEEYPGPYLNI